MSTSRQAAVSVAAAVLLAAACAGPRAELARDAAALELLLDVGRYAEAEDLGRRLMEAARGLTLSPQETVRLRVLLVRALLLNGRGAAPSTLLLALEAVHPEREAGMDRIDPSALEVLGRVRTAAGDHAAAVSDLQRAATTLSDPGDRAEALDFLGIALTAAGRYDDAIKTLEDSLRLKEQTLSPADVRFARTLEAIGWARQLKGDYPAARQAIDRAVAVHEAADATHPSFVETLNLLHQQLWFEGRLADARGVARRAVALGERTLRPDHPVLARALRFQAMAEWTLGDLQLGRALRQRAYEIAVHNFGEEHHETAMYLHDLALADSELGDYPLARTRFTTAARLFEARFGERHDFVATALHNLAVVHASLGDFERASRDQARATDIWQRTLGRDHPFVAFGLTELARVLREQGRLTDAADFSQRALAIRERALGPDHPDVARTLDDVARVAMLSGRLQLARASASRALAIWEGQNVPDAPAMAAALALAGELELRGGSVEDSRHAFERALAIQIKALGPSHPRVAETQSELAITSARAGRGREALRYASAAEHAAREHLRLMLRNLSERQSLSYAATRPTGLPLMLSLAQTTPAVVSEAFDAMVRSRALVLDEMAARRRRGGDAESVPLRRAQQRLANLLVRGPADMPPTAYVQVVDDARQEVEHEEQLLAAKSAAFRSEQQEVTTGWREVQARLDPDVALVSFVRYQAAVSPARRSTASGSFVYAAFVVRAAMTPRFQWIGTADAVEALVGRWRSEVAVAAPSARQTGTRLRQLVWDPVAAHLDGVSRVLVVPDAALALVPLAALPIGESSYLVEREPVLHYLSAERDVVSITTRAAVPAQGLLALGGPAYDEQAAAEIGLAASRGTVQVRDCVDLATIRFQPLLGTALEVNEIEAIWRRARHESGSIATLLGQQASESALRAEAPRHSILHVATHGFFLGRDCTAAPSTSTRGVGGLTATQPTRVENPLLLSGLALAGANRRAQARADEDDGILTAEEVAMLDLQGVEWAVLSACDTGVGEVRAGEGVFGLRRAFQVAGARTVIMSVWSVDDRATRAWMRALYEGRFQGRLSTADAVRQASLTVLRDRRARGLSTHPFYWAAFLAAGDWR